MKKSILIIGSIAFLFSCSPLVDNRSGTETGNTWSDKFTIRKSRGYSVLTIINPWQKARNTGFTCVLKTGNAILPDSMENFPVIPVPVKKVVVLSTTHIGFISALHEENSIAGVSGFNYVYDGKVRERIREGWVKDVGYVPALDYEAIISLHPDLVFLYGLNASVTAVSERLQKAGIPSVIIAEYLENHPLGKMEWLKVFGALYGKEDLAESLFTRVAEEYTALAEKASAATPGPAVLAGLPWKDTWYMAGGNSFMARLIHDAGGDYLWKDDPSDEYIPLDLETAFMKAWKAGCWINTGTARDLAEIAARDERFKNLPVYKAGNVFNNDARLNPEGGNDYWESGVVNPEKILADLIKILHPGLAGDHEFVYYRKLE